METKIPPQHQNTQPGIEAELIPQPKTIRDTYKGANKLKGKVALITGGDHRARSLQIHRHLR